MHAPLIGRWLLALLLLTPLQVMAQGDDNAESNQDLPTLIREIFPEATEIKPRQDSPPVWPIYQVTELIGYAFLSGDYVKLPGFSGAPYQLLIGIDRNGLYRGVRVLEQHEPIFLHGLGPEPMHAFTRQYPGLDLRHPIKITSATVRDKHSGSNVYIDGITKATVSAVVLNETVMLSALQAAQATGLIPRRTPPARVREDLLESTDWTRLVGEHWIESLALSDAQVEQAFDAPQEEEVAVDATPTSSHDFIDLQFAYINPPTLGRYLLGDAQYQQLMTDKLEPGEHAFLLINRGPYSIVGEDFTPATPSDRLALEQNGVQIELRDMNLFSISPFTRLAALQQDGMPEPQEVMLFRVKAAAGFDPASSWKLSLVVKRSRGYLQPDEIRSFSRDYQLPGRLFVVDQVQQQEALPLWLQIWQQRTLRIAVLALGLGLLSAIILGHRWVTAKPRRFRLIRWSYLLYTLIFIGYLTQGQLSITNVFSILQVISGNADASVLLLDPIIFILWCYVLLTLVLWGRGYFCGWLCPFGVLQEMAAELATRLKIRQRRIPFALHRRLWGLKYLILAGLVGVSFWSITVAERAAEVEPFKTAITLGFVREWPFVIYAVLLLVAGLYVHKFFCRYLCPLGAFFAVVGHFHLFRWLPRRNECGSPCQLCSHRCGIRAIEPDGKINYRECIQCYECEVIYRDDHQCVPLINERRGKKRPTAVIARG